MLPCAGKWSIAFTTLGNQLLSTNHTTIAVTSAAAMNCISSNLAKESWAKAATPRGVNGCQADRVWSTDDSMIAPVTSLSRPDYFVASDLEFPALWRVC